MSRILRFISAALVLFLGFVFGLIAVLTVGDEYLKAAESYARTNAKTVIYLHQVPEELQSDIISEMIKTIDEKKGFITRADALRDNDGNASGLKFGFHGDPEVNASAVRFDFLGNSIFNSQNIAKLLQAESGATLGLDRNIADRIIPLPEVLGGKKVVGVKLVDLVRDTETVNANYRIDGLEPRDFDQLVDRIAALLQVNRDSLLEPQSGGFVYGTLLITIAFGAGFASWLVLVFLSILGAYQSMAVLGTHVLLGWTRLYYARKVFAPVVAVSFLGVLVAFAFMLYGLQGFSVGTEIILRALLAATPVIGLTLLAVAAGTVSLFLISPVNAIRNRVSSKVLVASLVALYLAASGALVGTMRAIDGPLVSVAEMHEVQQRWVQYSHLNVLYKEKIGDNATSFTGQRSDHSVEYYNWYSSIEGRDGVFLAHSQFCSAECLEFYRENGIYKHIPNQPFWSVLASPNYLAAHDIAVSPEHINLAHSGERVYLIPDSLSDVDRKQLEAHLIEVSISRLESLIQNDFTREQRFSFVTYHADKNIFLWNTDTKLPNAVPDPVLLVATAANMIPFESESLWASGGLENSYLKLTSEAAEKYLDVSYLAKYNLDDNEPVFLPVSQFIAGLQKSISETIQLFGAAVLLIAVLGTIVMTSLVKMFSIVRREQIAVKRLMGHSLRSVFLPPILLVVCTTVVCAIVALALRSTSGALVLTIFGLFQFALLMYQARRASMRGIVSLIKSTQ
ncbi:hypothetical protein KJY77_05500 [Canibacter sp. lx-72]|uniref:hypothetical protein n=1 Tax=Canibacter zhuwentaonis TaxID=2837491 RepID=UPI001BDC3ABC|nr:hypothetical protein [Canibacter zhuwentaonis]MBT1018585.1 hypothetical protein [Canibacter zhuwentaonis]